MLHRVLPESLRMMSRNTSTVEAPNSEGLSHDDLNELGVHFADLNRKRHKKARETLSNFSSSPLAIIQLLLKELDSAMDKLRARSGMISALQIGVTAKPMKERLLQQQGSLHIQSPLSILSHPSVTLDSPEFFFFSFIFGCCWQNNTL